MRLLRWALAFSAFPLLLGQTGCDPASFLSLFMTSLVQSITYSLISTVITALSSAIFPAA
jgi:hypothetical protein